jgi:hypothetical protein
VERVFGSIRSLLFEHLPGYTGIDAADRGADPEGDSTLTVDAMEHLIATWPPLAAQRRERARIRSEKGIRWGQRLTKATV